MGLIGVENERAQESGGGSDAEGDDSMSASDFLTAIFQTPSLELCYKMGRDYAANGATEENCNFLLFGSPEKTRAWERGRDDASGDAK